MKAIIMAGGLGTRIASIANNIPKPMIKICGKPILEYQIENLKSCGIVEIILVIGHLGSVISDYFGDGTRFGVNISYFVEDHPLGTAGALFKIPELNEDFLLLCGDIIFDVDFNRFINFHVDTGAWASLLVHPNGHPYDSSLLVTEIVPPTGLGGLPVDTHRVIKWMNKEDERVFYKNRVNAGIQIISPSLLRETKKIREAKNIQSDKIDLDRDVLKSNIATGKIFAYDSSEYVKDMGTPDRFYETENDIQSGKVKAKNLVNKQRAVFLDRDGTINESNGFITHPDQFVLMSGVASAIKTINKSGFLAIVITNQPVIARGDCSFEELQLIHDKMETELGKEGAFIDGIYFCPHHTDKGFPGERIEYKCICDCRKPKTGMLRQAASDLNIDITQSFMVGDSESDIITGISAGCRDSILVSDSFTLLDFTNNYL